MPQNQSTGAQRGSLRFVNALPRMCGGKQGGAALYECGLCPYSSVLTHPGFTALHCTIHNAKKLNVSNLAEKPSHIRLIIFLNCTTLESQQQNKSSPSLVLPQPCSQGTYPATTYFSSLIPLHF